MDTDTLGIIVTAITATIGTVAAALSGVAIARINATKDDVGKAREQVTEVHHAAVAARNYSESIGNGYADESRAAWRRIEERLNDLTQRHTRTNSILTRHINDHAAACLRHHGMEDES